MAYLILVKFINMQTLQGKQQNLIVCKDCKFFPNASQLEQLIRQRTIFGLNWKCSFCTNYSFTPTDLSFRFYKNVGVTIDKHNLLRENIVILIETSNSMEEEFVRVPSAAYAKVMKINQISKQKAIEECQLFKSYLSFEAASQRLKKGRGFSWNNFLQAKTLSKIQYALWLTDQICKEFSNVFIIFFSTCEKNYKQKVSFKQFLKTPEQVINGKFLKNIEKKRYEQFACEQQLDFSDLQEQKILVIADQNPSFMKNIAHDKNIIFRKVADRIDPITLKPRTQANIIDNRWGKVKCYYKRAEQLSMSQKNYSRDILSLLNNAQNQVAIFTKKSGSPLTKHQKYDKGWENVIKKRVLNLREQKKKNEKDGKFIFETNRKKMQGIIDHIQTMCHEKSINTKLLGQICQYLSTNLNGIQVRVYLKLYNQKDNSNYTLLWSCNKYVKKSDNKRDEGCSYDIIQELCTLDLHNMMGNLCEGFVGCDGGMGFNDIDNKL